jgi:uncharacterized protein YeaO (DUF488 family)
VGEGRGSKYGTAEVFGHDPAKWKQFQIRYRKELQEKKDALHRLKQTS